MGNTLNEKLFYPFGELWTGAAMPDFKMHQTFAKLPDYDAETDQYNTLNRHYSPSGRWMSPEPGGMKVIHLDAPQTWNLYAYVANNPTTLADPSGLDEPPPPGSSANMYGTIDPDCMLKDAQNILAALNADGQEQAALVAYLIAKYSTPPTEQRVIAKRKGKTVTYTYPDGSKVVLTGTHPWRDNNPGDLKSGHGSIGRDAGGGNVMAIYPSAAAGWEALADTLAGKYGDMSIIDTMKQYAPVEDGNDPTTYAATLAAAVGVPVSTKISELTPAQFATVQINIAVAEGYFDAGNSAHYIAPPAP